MGSLRAGLRKEVILGLLWAVQHGVPDFSGDAGAQQQPQISFQAAPQTSAQTEQEQPPDHKMIEDEDEDDTRNQESNTKENETSQTLSSTVRFYISRESYWTMINSVPYRPSHMRPELIGMRTRL
jgi:hypothetical protein